MSRGDMLLFHSEHFHASPTEQPDLSRVIVEFRVTTNCQDSNAMYLHLFWNLRNFSPLDTAEASLRSAKCHDVTYLKATMLPVIDWRQITSPQHCFNALFTSPEAARMAGNPRASHRFIHHIKSLDEEVWTDVCAYLLDAPYVDDLSLALVRILLLTSQPQRADRFTMSMLDHSKSYIFLMELGLLLGRFDKITLATKAYEIARHCAANSDVTMDPFNINIPNDTEADGVFKPATAINLCNAVLEHSPRDTLKSSNINLFDYRIYLPRFEVIQIESEGEPLRLMLNYSSLLLLRRNGDPDGILWCCELDEWMTKDKLPADVETEEGVSLELAKQHYLDLPQLISALIYGNQKLTEENETLKKALQSDK
jgi:hypothetical protein